MCTTTRSKLIQIYLIDYAGEDNDIKMHSVYAIEEPMKALARRITSLADVNLKIYGPACLGAIEDIAKTLAWHPPLI
jgi:hypothetical protein